MSNSASSQNTAHVVIDIETKLPYFIVLDEEGTCIQAEFLVDTTSAVDGQKLASFSAPPTLKGIPFGETCYCIERKAQRLDDEGNEIRADEMGAPLPPPKANNIFTIQWPSKEDYKNDVMPLVVYKPLPEDMADAGIAATIRTHKGLKSADDPALKRALEELDELVGLEGIKKDIVDKINTSIWYYRIEEKRKSDIVTLEAQQKALDEEIKKSPEDKNLQDKSEEIRKKLKYLHKARIDFSYHMVLTGNPGTGKTTLARLIAKIYHAAGILKTDKMIETNREGLVAGYVGQTAIKTQAKVKEAMDGVLFIDEAYALGSAGRKAGGGKDFGEEAIEILVDQMEKKRDRFVVIAAGYDKEMKDFIDMNPGLASRFGAYFNFPDFSREDLGKIMELMVKNNFCNITPDAVEAALDIIEARRATAGKDFANAREARKMVQQAILNLSSRMRKEGELSKDVDSFSDDTRADYYDVMTTITVDDVKNVSLEAITNVADNSTGGKVCVKLPQTSKKGFQTAFNKEANDNKNQIASENTVNKTTPKKKKSSGPGAGG